MAIDRSVKKAFIRYTKKKYPGEADGIINKADELFPTAKNFKGELV